MKTIRSLKIVLGILGRSLGMDVRSVASPGLTMGTWVRQLRDATPPPARRHIALIAIRNSTWIEFAAYAACWMRKLALAPILIYSGSDVRRIYGDPGSARTLKAKIYFRDFWENVRQIPDIELFDLDGQPAPSRETQASYADFAADYAHTVAAYDLRVEERDGSPIESEYRDRVEQEALRLARWGAVCEKLFRDLDQRFDLDRVIAYSGLIDVSSAIGQAARRVGWETVFCEGWAIQPGHMVCNIDAPSLDYRIPVWLEALGEWEGQASQEIKSFMAFQESAAIPENGELTDYHRVQRSAATDELPEHVEAFLRDDRPILLLAPNVVGDSATLRRSTIFQSQGKWIAEIVDFFRHHPQYKLIIRAHPDEHYLGSWVFLKMGDLAEQAAAGVDNILVIKGDQNVNTYALIPHVHGGLVWLSTVGVDMVARNCPVVAAGRPMYHGMGIVHEPDDKREYFDALRHMLECRTGTSAEQKTMAMKYLAIATRKVHYKAFSPAYQARDLHLTGHPPQGELVTFYRILAGQLPLAARPNAEREG